ncbi:YhjD/YihY/BrkB family envelope integrity protein [Actinacidiphila sp. ITFR-21]|uniref:YhjD/YihY/BrkB family envelope integrity protein n=1 Tax=Actinacidiphila sp. ITFR-21 TaxID=3075199 RepID=UPI0028898A32|nr:YhjD/YihY/BrkB family envelope integrity protein [Streptomyces sp. ITFR-21]WNI19397.1 YhjD/YihY/BrkB family envelope integrity protein [Streptomyces sp. ITFR-21]
MRSPGPVRRRPVLEVAMAAAPSGSGSGPSPPVTPRGRLGRRQAALRRAAERRFPVITALTARLLTVNLLDAATRLAAQLFLTAVPLMFVAAALTPEDVRDQLVDSARDLFGLSGASEEQLRQLFASGHAAADTDTDTARQTTGAIGSLAVLLSATAASRAMTRVCERAWRLPRGDARPAVWRWFVWIVAWLAVLVLQGPLRNGFGLGLPLGLPLLLLVDTAVWWWTQHFLLGGRMRWRPLLPGAVLTAVAMAALAVTARVYMPTALNRSVAAYGPLGTVFTLLSWLIAVCAAITFTLTAGAVLAEGPARAPFRDRARRVRSRDR